MGDDELTEYEASLELALVKEYKTVVGLFHYAVETDRRFYLAKDVKVDAGPDGKAARVEIELTDAWVWDMYRTNRFVPHVRVMTFRDVNIERLPEEEMPS